MKVERLKGRNFRLRMIAMAALFLPLLVARPADFNDELAKIKAEIEKERRQLEAKEEERGKILGQLETLDKRVKFFNDKIRVLERRQSELQRNIKVLESDLVKIKADLAKRKDLLGRRLTARYKLGEVGTLQILFSSDSISNLVLLDEYLGRVYQRDQQLIEEYRAEQETLERKKAELQEQQVKLSASLAGERWAREQIESEKDGKKQLLESVQKESDKHLALIAELDAAAGQLENKMKSLQKQTVKESEFALFQGKLCMPVSGRILVKYGVVVDPDFKTKTMQKGVDISGRKGDRVYAVYAGQVVYADWFRGYGNLIIIDHGSNYYTLYAHLDRMDKVAGQTVKKGEAIGTVGDSGSLKGPYLYFELRHHSEAVNPEHWLNESCAFSGR